MDCSISFMKIWTQTPVVNVYSVICLYVRLSIARHTTRSLLARSFPYSLALGYLARSLTRSPLCSFIRYFARSLPCSPIVLSLIVSKMAD